MLLHRSSPVDLGGRDVLTRQDGSAEEPVDPADISIGKGLLSHHLGQFSHPGRACVRHEPGLDEVIEKFPVLALPHPAVDPGDSLGLEVALLDEDSRGREVTPRVGRVQGVGVTAGAHWSAAGQESGASARDIR